MNTRERKYAETLSKMIQMETISHIGQFHTEKFYAFQNLLKQLFPNLFSAAEFEDFQGSILLRWPGKDSCNLPVLFMNHYDVVEANGGWTYPPFSGTIADGKVWGRGTLDTKGGLFGMLQAADELSAEGFVPQTDLYFLSSCTEEINGTGADIISAELARRGIQFSMVLDEGGMIVYEPIGGAKGHFAMVGLGEKGVAELQFIAHGHGGHSSTPTKDTPLVRLGKFMAEVDRSNVFQVELSPAIREMFVRLSPRMSGPLKYIFAHPNTFSPLLKKVMPSVSATANALLRTTIAFTMASGSEGRNVIPTEASVVASMRVSHHQGFESSLAEIKRYADKYQLETVVLDPAINSGLADYTGREFALIQEAIENCFPDVITAPYLMTGASDARFLSRVCNNCFRFVPFMIDDQQLGSVHGIDENVNLSTLVPAVEFYKYLMKKVP